MKHYIFFGRKLQQSGKRSWRVTLMHGVEVTLRRTAPRVRHFEAHLREYGKRLEWAQGMTGEETLHQLEANVTATMETYRLISAHPMREDPHGEEDA